MRDVIQVERAEGPDAGPASMAELARVADELLPPLVARLGVSDLGEIEVRQGTWRVRIRRALGDVPANPAGTAGHVAAGPGGHAPTAHAASIQPTGGHQGGTPPASDQATAISTAVGYFALKAGITVGQRVTRGDVLGWVDVLGVRMEIVSPESGVVGRIVTEPGDPVEYGQELVALVVPTGSAADPAAHAQAEDATTPPSTPGAA